MKLQDYSEILKKIIDSALGFTSQKLAGQFITPEPLAKYLASITIINREGDVIDPCCGTGTIAKAAYNLKCDKGMPVDLALGTTWASDKFSSPLQLCSIRLSDPQLMGEVVQVFQEDAFKVLPEQPIDFTDPSTGETTQRQLLKFHGVISNLPFVQFEDFRKYNDFVDEVRENLKTRHQTIPSNKADLYAYLALKLRDIVSQDGRLGFILSNSWLGSMWGKDFRDCLLRDYRIKQIVMSGSGRWFEPKAVTTILVLEPREPGQSPDKDDEEISFITTLLPIEQWDEEELEQLTSSTILGEPIEGKLSIQKLTLAEIESLESTTGVDWSAFFTNTSWLHKLNNSLVPITEYFCITRGQRAYAANWFFYPKANHGIESEYIKKIIKSPRDLPDSLIAEPTTDAFFCSDSLEVIRNKGNTGTLRWIDDASLTLPEKIKGEKPNLEWYEMLEEDKFKTDLAIAINPDKKLIVYKTEKPTFADQRITVIRKKDSLESLDVAHALLNSVIGMFLIESIGFGRGLGVLDLNKSKIESNLKILDPQNLSEEDIQVLLDAFEPLVNRAPMDLPSELESEDRINFDDTVISLYNLDINRDEVYKSLLELFEKRQTARLKT